MPLLEKDKNIMENKTLERLELKKILAGVASFAVSAADKRGNHAGNSLPFCCRTRGRPSILPLRRTPLCSDTGRGRVEEFPEQTEELQRAQKGASLSCKELLNAALLLRSARVAFKSVKSLQDLPLLNEIADGIYFDEVLEKDITDKILSGR